MDLKDIIARLEEIAPSNTAEEWDNVGLLVEPCGGPTRVEHIFLTNDLTEGVLDEALLHREKRVGLIVSYHPPLFTPLKRLTQKSFKERILLKAIEARVAIYSPHTAHDNLTGGVNDWLVSGLGEGQVTPLRVQQLAPSWPHCVTIKGLGVAEGVATLSHIVAQRQCGEMAAREGSDDAVILSNDRGLCSLLPAIKERFPDNLITISAAPKVLASGAGRLLTLSQPVLLSTIVERVKQHLHLPYIRLATPHSGKDLIRTIAVCAGSGDGVLQSTPADLLLAGEMTHHRVLEAVSKGSCVVLCEHSNTERGFLKELKERLRKVLQSDVGITVSSVDRDPLCVV